jgi:hypothetical protein
VLLKWYVVLDETRETQMRRDGTRWDETRLRGEERRVNERIGEGQPDERKRDEAKFAPLFA